MPRSCSRPPPPTTRIRPSRSCSSRPSTFPSSERIVATRRRRSPNEPEVWAAHLAVVEGDARPETSRSKPIAPVSSAGAAPSAKQPPYATAGRFRTRSGRCSIPSSRSAAASWSRRARPRASPSGRWSHRRAPNSSTSSTSIRTATRSSGPRPSPGPRRRCNSAISASKPDEAGDFQRLAGHIVYADPRLRPSSEAIRRGAGAQSGLWPHGISGDLPIVLLRIDDVEDMEIGPPTAAGA